MRYSQEIIQHKHVLTQDEFNDVSKKMAQAKSEITTLKDDQKSMNSSFKAKIDQKNANLDLYALQIKDGYVFLDIMASKRKNFETGHWEWFNEDTAEVYKTEPFSSKMDYQMSVEDQEEWDAAHKVDEKAVEDGEAQDLTDDEDFNASFLMLGTGITEPEETDDDPADPDDSQDEETDSEDDGQEEPKKGRGRPRKK